MRRARGLEVTADGMTRVAAVVAAMVESSIASAPGMDVSGKLTDLIAKAAQAVEHHAGSTQVLRRRGLALRDKARESLAAAKGGPVAAPTPRFDVTR